jgi:ketol-acid reductoisomerase
MHALFQESGLSRLMRNNYSNVAQLKDLMTAPPMTAARHAELMRKRIAQRRMLEEAREMKRASGSFDKG